jgi:hypothetical protein
MKEKLMEQLADGLDYANEYPEIHFDDGMDIEAIAQSIVNYQEQGASYAFTKENHQAWLNEVDGPG